MVGKGKESLSGKLLPSQLYLSPQRCMREMLDCDMFSDQFMKGLAEVLESNLGFLLFNFLSTPTLSVYLTPSS